MCPWKTCLNDAGTAVESGKRIEDRVADFLSQQNEFRLLHRNYRAKGGELDFVGEETRSTSAGSKTELVILEVRARQSSGWVSGLESVTSQKRRRIERAAQAYLMSYRGRAQSVRFDVISVDEKGLQWFRAAWG